MSRCLDATSTTRCFLKHEKSTAASSPQRPAVFYCYFCSNRRHRVREWKRSHGAPEVITSFKSWLLVKCDEVHPRCGPCSRLSKDCDWEFRWKFDDVTANTQNKYNNVSTAGNAVWDPQARRTTTDTRSSGSPVYDNLPSFAELTNDEDRERKAESMAPGTFNVVVNPGSFASLPEYGAFCSTRQQRPSLHSDRTSFDSFSSSDGGQIGPRARTARGDPNTVVLSKFEDAPLSLPSISSFSVDRRTSLPDNMQRLEITVSPRGSSLPLARNDSVTQMVRDERLMVHYRGFIAKRIMPLGKHFYLEGPGQDDPIVAEARNFPPLYHAICAVSLLSLALKGQQQLLTEAFQHYHQAISSSLSLPSDLHSDRLLYLHFLLLVYDICYATQGSSNPQDGFNMNMWVHHIQHLLRIAQHRKGLVNGELQAYILWYVLYLDTQACFAGSGTGAFVRAVLNQEIALPCWKRVPESTHHAHQTFPNEDSGMYAAVYELNNQICMQGCKISQLALQTRSEAAMQDVHGTNTQALTARHQIITQAQNELYATWHRYCPPYLAHDSEYAGSQLPVLARIVFEYAMLQFSTLVVYTNSSLYQGQQLHINENQRREMSLHCRKILAQASLVVEAQNFDQHHIVYPIFLAGFASTDVEGKSRAVSLMRVMEGTGISCNATRSRELLVAVCEEQRMRLMAGGRSEEVDWVNLAKINGLGVVNFGI